MSRMSHRNICKYVDSFVGTGNKLYLIMEYADKGDLEQYLARLKSMAAASSSIVGNGNNLRYSQDRKSISPNMIAPEQNQLTSTNGLIELGEQRTWKFFI